MRPSFIFSALVLSLIVIVTPVRSLRAATQATRLLPSVSVYRGVIVAKNPLSVVLNLSRTGKNIQGTYQYGTSKKNIFLDGTQQDQMVHLNERATKKGIIGAEFNGTVNGDGRIDGTWKDTKTGKALPFHLEEMGNDLKNNGLLLSGGYRVNGRDQTIDLLSLDATHLKIQGYAQWANGVEDGAVNSGSVSGIATQQTANVFVYTEQGDPEGCKITIHPAKNMLTVEDNGTCGGLNVSFAGKYKRVSATVAKWDIYNIDHAD